MFHLVTPTTNHPALIDECPAPSCGDHRAKMAVSASMMLFNPVKINDRRLTIHCGAYDNHVPDENR